MDIVSSELKINIHGSCNFNAERARRLRGKRRCSMYVIYMRFSTDACDDFYFIRLKIKRPTSYGNIFMQFQRSIDYRRRYIVKNRILWIIRTILMFLFSFLCHVCSTIFFLRTFLKCIDVWKIMCGVIHDVMTRVFRLWAEVFHVNSSGGGSKWQQVSEDLVPVNITCVQDSPECVFHITAYNSQVDKILDVRLVQPGEP